MQRDLDRLAGRSFDLVVIGGGIAGAAAACDAARRGLSVALIERSDFAAASSSNLFKIAHGGIRYLQHADLARLRQSARARNLFLKIAPHLVRPLDIVVPTHGIGLAGRAALRLGLLAYDAATIDLRRMLRDPEQQVPFGRMLTRAELKERFPWLPADGLTGAGIFTEGRITSPARVVLAFAMGAAAAGAVVANRVEATGFLLDGGRVRGVRAVDRLTGEPFTITARLVLDGSGPYASGLSLSQLAGGAPSIPYSRDAWFLVGRRLVAGDAAIALTTESHDPDAVVSRGNRHLFLVPWRERTMVGVWHKPVTGSPDDFSVSEEELASWIAEVNAAAPFFRIERGDVELVQAGFVPFGENPNGVGDNLRYGHRSHYIDHAASGAAGCASLVAVRYTTAPLEAIGAIDRLSRHLDRKVGPSRLAEIPLPGGDFTDRREVLRKGTEAGLAAEDAASLVNRHGTGIAGLLQKIAARPALGQRLAGTETLAVELRAAIEMEMAQDLADILFRRTETLTIGAVSRAVLEQAAAIAGDAAGWSRARCRAEVERVEALLAERLAGRALLGRPFAVAEPAAEAIA